MGDMVERGRVGEALSGEDEAIQAEEGADDILTEEHERAIVEYVTQQLEENESGREGMRRNWATWRRHRRIKPQFAVKNDPWPNASNLVPPVTASNTNGVYSYLRRAFLRRKPLLMVTPVNPRDMEMLEEARAWERFLNRLFESPVHMDGQRHLKTSLYEAISMGTQFIELPWVEKVKSAKRRMEGTTGFQDVLSLSYEGPAMVPLRIEDFFAPLDREDIQDDPWIAVRYPRVPLHVLKANEARGFFKNVTKIAGSEAKTYEENEETHLLSQGIATEPSPGDTRVYDLYKAWAYWDIDGDGFEEDVVVWFERTSKVVLRVEMNDLFVRPIVRMPYFPEPFSLYAVGVGSMAEHVQEEITTLHNMRIDGLRLTNQQLVGMRKGAGLGPKEKIFPLRVLELDDPERDLKLYTFPDISGGTLQAEEVARGYLNMFTGVSEAMLGMPDTTAKSGTSPSLQMFLAQQGNAILETATENIADALGLMGQIITMQLIRNADAIAPTMMSIVPEEDRVYIERVLQIPLEELPNVLTFSVSTTDASKTEDAKRQNLLALNQLYTLYYQEGLQLQGIIASPETPPEAKAFALKVFVGKTKIMEETIALLGQANTQELMPYHENLQLMVAMIEQQQRMQMEAMREQYERGQGGGQSGGGEQQQQQAQLGYGGPDGEAGMVAQGGGAMDAGGMGGGMGAPAGVPGPQANADGQGPY